MSLRTRIYLALFPLILLSVLIAVFLVRGINEAYWLDQYIFDNERELSAEIAQIELNLNLLDYMVEDSVSASQMTSAERAEGLVADLFERSEFFLSKLNQDKLERLLRHAEKFRDDMAGIRSILDASGSIGSGNVNSIRELNRSAKGQLKSIKKMLDELVTTEREDFQHRLSKTQRLIFAVVLLAATISVVFSLWLWKHIVTPIESISRDMKSLGTAEKIPTDKRVLKDELACLRINFERMASRIEEYRRLSDERALRLTKAFRTVVEQSPDAFFILTTAFKPLYSSPRAQELIYEADLMENLPKAVDDTLRTTLTTGRAQIREDLEQAIPLKVGETERWFLLNAFPIEALPDATHSDGQEQDGFQYLAAVFQDVTLQKLSESLRRDVMATVSHELKTPITSARMSIYLLLEEQAGKLNEDQKGLLETARDDLNRQLLMIENLLEISRMEESSRQVTLKEFDLMSVLRNSVDAHKEYASSEGVELKLCVDSDRVFVEADEYKLGVVINNLIVNGVRHSPPDGEVRVRLSHTDGEIKVSVADQGEGIEPDQVERVFDAEKAHYSERVSSNRLALKIAKDIVIAHGGMIHCQSQPAKGTLFYFTIPDHKRSSV